MKDKLKILGSKSCPFFERSVIMLQEKKLDFEIEYIDLANKPDWFLKISPLAKSPILLVNDTVLFESNVINEYLDEVYGDTLHPRDPLVKAQNRGMIEFGSNIIVIAWQLCNEKTQNEFELKLELLKSRLKKLNDVIGNNKFMNGDKVCFVDFSYAPLLNKLNIMKRYFLPTLFDQTPNLEIWIKAVLTIESVSKILAKTENDFLTLLKTQQDRYILNFLTD